MIQDKRMKFVKSVDGFDLYIFSPTFFRLYFEKRDDDAPHRYILTHKIHMLMYLVFGGGYKILYLADKNDCVLSYIIFKTRADKVVDGANKNDFFTIFLWTYPRYRNLGLSTKLANYLLEKNNIFYKVIAPNNAPSIKVAEKVGFALIGRSKKKKKMKIFLDNQGDWLLYKYNKRMDR